MNVMPVRLGLRWRKAAAAMVCVAAMLCGARVVAAQNQVMGELEFDGRTKLEQGAGVWVDGNYVGYIGKNGRLIDG